MTVHAQTSFQPDMDAGAEQRGGARTAMFVSAACLFRGQVHAVRIRNMSRDGALLEGAELPPERARFELMRGSLHVRAKSMWTHGNQCGASLLEPVDVARWMARAVPVHQQQVDSMVHQARLAIAAGKPGPDEIVVSAGPRSGNVKTAISLLEDLEKALSEDALVVARHLDGLQSLDAALQLLRVVAGRPA
jgi:hypothetical protein